MNTLTIYLTSTALLLILSFLIFRIVVRRDYIEKGRLTLLSVVLETSIFFMLGGFPYIYGIQGWPEVKVGLILEIVGWTFLVAGLLVIASGMVQLGLRSIFGQGSHDLKQTGLYSFSRNPQILGCWMYVVGFTQLWPSWYALGWAILFGIVAHMMVLTEEEYLEKVFGETYLGYCESVPRYIKLGGIFKRAM
jgi:protein-S-isoprenylcysteine O-methyltransferase Ste14